MTLYLFKCKYCPKTITSALWAHGDWKLSEHEKICGKNPKNK